MRLKSAKRTLLVLLLPLLLGACEENKAILEGLNLSSKALSFPAAGDSKTITFTAPSDWEADVAAEWVKLSPSSGKEGDVTVTVTVQANPTTSVRSTRITLKIPEKSVYENITVEQAAGEEDVPPVDPPVEPSVTLSAEQLSFVAAGESLTLTLESNVAWSVSSKPEWLAVTPSSGEAGKVTLTVAASANAEYEERQGVLSFAAGEASASVPVKQAAAERPFINVSAEQLSFVAAGESLTLTLESNVAWSVSSKPEWLVVTPSSGDAGKVTLTVAASANAEYEERQGVLSFAAGEASASVPVKQAGSNPGSDPDTSSNIENPEEGDPWEW